MTDPRIDVVQDFFERYFSGDVASASSLPEDHVAFHVSARHELSGVFQGLKSVSEHLQRSYETAGESPAMGF
jgi:ketosteroid isomerase-like protein